MATHSSILWKFHGQTSLVGYILHGVGKSRHDLATERIARQEFQIFVNLKKKNYIAFPRMWEREKPLFSFKFNEK